jgi:ATP-dependent exoDNAse (exonuclease V) beta subunit
VTAEEKHLPGRPSADAAPAAADDPTRVITADTPSRRADVGLAWGTLVHGLLEHAMRHPAATRDDLRRLAMWLTFEVPELRDVIDEALDTVEAVVRADFWQQAIASDERQEEVPFTTIEPGALPTVVSGAIDLAYRTGAAWHIVDYKTDRDGTPETLAERYTAQVEAYARAWTRVTGAKPETQVVSARRR